MDEHQSWRGTVAFTCGIRFLSVGACPNGRAPIFAAGLSGMPRRQGGGHDRREAEMPRRNKRNRRDHRKKEYWNKKYRQKGLENNVYMTIGEAVFCTRIVHRGEVWYADLGRFDNTSVQRGCRPVLIISNDDSN